MLQLVQKLQMCTVVVDMVTVTTVMPWCWVSVSGNTAGVNALNAAE